jgi:hypothetical protein
VVALLAAFLIAGYAGAHSVLIKGDLLTNRSFEDFTLIMAVKLIFFE